MDATPAANTAPATPNTTSYALEDNDGADAAIAQDANGAAPVETKTTEAAPAKTEAPDPDKLVLEISRRDRESRQRAQAVERKSQELTKREQELNSRHESVQKFAQLQAKAKSNPYEALTDLAALIGVDVDEAIEAVAVKAAGGTVKQLDPAERVSRLEKELADKEAKAEAQRKEAEEKQAEAASEAKIQAHVNQLSSLAKSSENFPLVQGESPEELAANVNEAFDLMVLSWQAEKQGQADASGNPIKQLTHIQALNIVEKHLREKTEARARKLGLTPAQAKAQAAQTADTGLSVSSRTTPQASAQATPRTGLSPITATSSIKSDDEILADFQL
jgi:hypothetical protein